MIKTKAWERYYRYQLNWMAEHGYSLYELIGILSEMLDDDETGDLNEVYKQFEDEVGFNGEIWASFDEWYMNECKESEK